MMGPPVPEIVQCPSCRANNPAVEDRCQACGLPLAIYIGPAPRLPRRFGLGSLMILIALVAVGLGLTRELPGLGIPFLVLAVPALVRTFGWGATRKADGRPLTPSETLGAFLASFCLVLMMALGALFAFSLTFSLGFAGGAVVGSLWPRNGRINDVNSWGFLVGGPLGATASIYVLYRMGRTLWDQWE